MGGRLGPTSYVGLGHGVLPPAYQHYSLAIENGAGEKEGPTNDKIPRLMGPTVYSVASIIREHQLTSSYIPSPNLWKARSAAHRIRPPMVALRSQRHGIGGRSKVYSGVLQSTSVQSGSNRSGGQGKKENVMIFIL